MKIKSSLIALGAIALLGFASCSDDDTKSLSELKSEQEDAIEAFQSRTKISVVELKSNVLPATIDRNVYYHLRNGMYIKVLDMGDTSKPAVVGETTVFARLKGHQFTHNVEQSSLFDNMSVPSIAEIEFKYVSYYNGGDIHFSLISNTRPVSNLDALMCEGLAFPVSLAGVGNGARFSLIVPFELGPSSTYKSGVTTYVEEITYTFK